MHRLTSLAALATVAALTLAAVPVAGADAQSWGDRLKKKAEEAAKRKVEQRTEKRTGEATDKALDAVECAATDKACHEKKAAAAASKAGAGQAATPAGVTGATGGAASGAASGAAGSAAVSLKPGEGAWVNYDFVPGERVLFYEDFTKDNVGDFPRRLEYSSGNMEAVDWQGARYLRATTHSSFYVPLPETLPERFTVEIDFLGTNDGLISVYLDGESGASAWFWGYGTAGFGGSPGVSSKTSLLGQLVHARVMADGRYVKVYVNDMRVANVPNATFDRGNKLRIAASRTSDDNPMLIRSIRIAAGGKKLYDALSEKGRVATQGIYFDTGSDRIRPESTPTLKEIGQMLTEHSDLKLTIEGHTDNVGNAQANQELSQRRAAAVKAYLVEKHGIDASRLASAGFGDKKPAAKNDTPEGRQQNRRVELVKM